MNDTFSEGINTIVFGRWMTGMGVAWTQIEVEIECRDRISHEFYDRVVISVKNMPSTDTVNRVIAFAKEVSARVTWRGVT